MAQEKITGEKRRQFRRGGKMNYESVATASSTLRGEENLSGREFINTGGKR